MNNLGTVPIEVRGDDSSVNAKLTVAATVTLNLYTDGVREVLARIENTSVKSAVEAIVFNGNHVDISDRLFCDDADPACNVYYFAGTEFTQTAKVEAPAPATPAVKAGDTATVGGQQVKVTSAGTVQFTKSANRKNVAVPDAVTLADGRSYAVTSVAAKAFAGKKVRTVAIGRNVAKLARNAFKGSKATKVVVKTKKLSKKSVKGCFAGSKKANKAQVKKYKKVFTKKLTATKAKKLAVK